MDQKNRRRPRQEGQIHQIVHALCRGRGGLRKGSSGRAGGRAQAADRRSDRRANVQIRHRSGPQPPASAPGLEEAYANASAPWPSQRTRHEWRSQSLDGALKMKLYVTYGSPYARLARIIVVEKALEDRVEIIEAKTRAPGSPYYQINPSGRVPYLVDDSGVGMEDSQLICAYLDDLDGKPRFHNASRASDWT